MSSWADPAVWIEAGIILTGGVFFLLLLLYLLRELARRARLSSLVLRPVRIVVRWGGALLIASLILNKLFALNLVSVVAGGLALIAIGVVAVWSLLSHMSATMLLILLKPFRVHDWVEFPGENVAGEVIDLNLFYTLLDNGKGEHYIIPNNLFFQKTLRHIPGKAKEALDLGVQLGREQPAPAHEKSGHLEPGPPPGGDAPMPR